MTPGEFLNKAQVVWGKYDGERDELLGIWRGALRDIPPEKLQAAFDYMTTSCKYKPKPVDVFTALEELGLTASRPKDGEGLKYGVMLDYANKRRWDLMDDWRRKNLTLWKEAERDRWDGVWTVEARKRAHELAQVEYIAQNHGWPKDTVALFEITAEEIAGHNQFQLHFTDAQIAGFRKAGAMLAKKPERVFGFKSAGDAAPAVDPVLMGPYPSAGHLVGKLVKDMEP